MSSKQTIVSVVSGSASLGLPPLLRAPVQSVDLDTSIGFRTTAADTAGYQVSHSGERCFDLRVILCHEWSIQPSLIR